MKCHIHISATYKVLNMLEIIKEKKKGESLDPRDL